MRSRTRSRMLSWLVALALAVLAGATAVTATTAIPAQASTTPNNELSAIWCASTSHCVAVGASDQDNENPVAGHPLAETWNGKSWKAVPVRLPAGAASGGLLGLSCVRPASCVAVGYWGKGFTGHLLAESWNGKAWQRVSTPSPAPGIGGTLSGVSCASAVSCVAVGEKFGVNRETGFAQSWNGKAWTLASVPWPKATVNSVLNGVSCPALKSCVAVGATGVGLNAGVDNSGRAAAATWNGKTWRVVSVPAPAKGSSSVLADVSCPLAVSCVAAGKAGPTGSSASNGLSGFWNGTSWRLATAG